MVGDAQVRLRLLVKGVRYELAHGVHPSEIDVEGPRDNVGVGVDGVLEEGGEEAEAVAVPLAGGLYPAGNVSHRGEPR